MTTALNLETVPFFVTFRRGGGIGRQFEYACSATKGEVVLGTFYELLYSCNRSRCPMMVWSMSKPFLEHV